MNNEIKLEGCSMKAREVKRLAELAMAAGLVAGYFLGAALVCAITAAWAYGLMLLNVMFP